MSAVKKKMSAYAAAFMLGAASAPGIMMAEGPDDPAPEITPDHPNGKSVLFDNTHGQTAGQADWVIDGAFSDFAEGIADNGYHVEELRQTEPIELEDLQPYDVFVIPEANIPFKEAEQDAMSEYTENGGSIFFISDHYNADRNKNRWDSSEIMNGFRRGAYDNPTMGMEEDEINSEAMQGVESSDWLSDEFGIRFRYNAPGTVTADQIAEPSESFGITEGVEEVAMHAGSTLAVTDPDIAKGIVYLPDNLTENDKWGPAVDEGIYHGGGEEEGPYAAISKKQDGKAAFIGDSSPVEDASPKYQNEETGDSKTTYDGFQEADDAALLLNMVDWLAEEESYQSFSQTDITLDDESPLLNKEIPENTTQPEEEPWTQPSDGYDWYDMDTFVPGSYGSDEEPAEDPDYAFHHADVLPNEEPFTVELEIGGVNPGQTVSGYDVGMYLDGGQQIAQIQNEDGSWPSNYGYSEEFSVTADENGTAVKELTVRVQDGTEGNANLRLRNSGSNLYTTTVTIGESEGDPGNEGPEPMTIEEARNTPDGTEVEVEGVITSDPGTFGGQGFYLQDDTAGIYVFQHDNSFEKGQVVNVNGGLTTYQGMKELEDPASIEIQGTADLPDYQTVDTLDGSRQAERVTIDGGTIRNIEEYYSAFEFDLQKENYTTRVRIDNRTGISFDEFESRFEEGSRVSVSGIASIFGDTYQLLPLELEDIEAYGTAPEILDLSESAFDITEAGEIPVEVEDEDGDLASVTTEINGEIWSGSPVLSPLQWTPGEYELTVTAEDETGRTAERSFTINMNLSLDQLDELVELGKDQGYIKDVKTAKRLEKKAEDVQQAKNQPSRNGKWQALLHQMEAQAGKKIDKEYLDYWDTPESFTEN
ncbi:endonuclease [Salibacterium aidingense]|uniref:endonuclease n=1 Tax=Salibacterium aidingense TaxID=384933 RepID=UPI003BBB0A35